MKSVIVVGLAFAMGGLQAVASPVDNANLLAQPDVTLISAKIENAIAELPEKRTRENIQNAAFFVLARQTSSLDVKGAAIEIVIDRAQTIGDRDIVEALKMIDLGANKTIEARSPATTSSAGVTKQTASIAPPPSTISKGGSDY